jgi:SIR2-like protein
VSIAWREGVKDAVARRRAVILIGSGVSANSVNSAGNRPPTWGEFLATAYKSLGRRVRHIQQSLEQYDYLSACDYLRSEKGAASWKDLIREKFVAPQFQPADIHKAIFDLDCRIVTSLNFDKIYETYAIGVGGDTVVVKHYYDDDIRQTVAGTDRYIIKPHGSVDSISRMIFTLNDYAEARTKHYVFYELMTALLHTHTFLCLGCGLSDPDMKLIFEDYRYKFKEVPHFIVLPNPISLEEMRLIGNSRGLNVIEYNKRDNHIELTNGIQELAQAAAQRRDQIAALQNW